MSWLSVMTPDSIPTPTGTGTAVKKTTQKKKKKALVVQLCLIYISNFAKNLSFRIESLPPGWSLNRPLAIY